MARLSRQELEDIVARDMPGYRLSKQAAEGEDRTARDAAAGPADATTPSLSQLRHKSLLDKYGAPSARLDADAGERLQDADADDGDEIVTVEPTKAAAPWDVSASRPKVVVVSGREKRIVGRQG